FYLSKMSFGGEFRGEFSARTPSVLSPTRPLRPDLSRFVHRVRRSDFYGVATPLGATFSPGTIALIAPTAAGVSVSGRVAHRSRGISNAIVLLTGPDGSVLEARTNTFGNFRFKGVPAGQSYVLGVRARRYTFSWRVLSVVDDITNLEITPD
ncbi:MAG: carboxypeptidase-like regulatory domain-containing protein, partial [Pyrinomonadaceae bacterium]